MGVAVAIQTDARPMACYIDLDRLDIVWPEAQRALDERWVLELLRDFDEHVTDVIHVADTFDVYGKYHIIDGQHTAEVLRRRGYTDAVCLMHQDIDTTDARDSADRFYKLNSVRNVQRITRFKVQTVAGHDLQTMISEVLESTGFTVGRHNSRNVISAVGKLEAIARRPQGRSTLYLTLNLLKDIWPEDENRAHASILLSFARLVEANPTPRVTARLGKQVAGWWSSTEPLLRDAAGKYGGAGAKTIINKAIDAYNNGLRNPESLWAPLHNQNAFWKSIQIR